LATKLANPTGESPNDRGLSRRRAFQAVEASLSRLGTDVVDILYLHKEDHTTPLEETVHALADLVRQGKIRYFGVSNFRAWRVAEISRLCDMAGIDRPVVSQPYYNLLNRMPEVEHLPACAHYGLGVAPYSPLARGVLTGKYAADHAPAGDTRAASVGTGIDFAGTSRGASAASSALAPSGAAASNATVSAGATAAVTERKDGW
jgi:aryl-alcohol dehydrogenase-like predicted oxidoreductase